MAFYILRRTLGMFVVIFLVVTMVFIIVRVMPGDPAVVMLGPEATPDDIKELRKEWGLDRPIYTQYLFFLKEVISGNLGHSIFFQKPVLSVMAERIAPTVFLTFFSLLIAKPILEALFWIKLLSVLRCCLLPFHRFG